MRNTRAVRARLQGVKAISAGGGLKQSKVSLCIYSEHIDIPELTSLIGCRPTRAQVKGQLRHPPHGSGPAPLGHWFLDAPKRLGFEDKVQHLLGATSSSSAIWRRIEKSHNVQLRCGVFMHSFNEGFELAAETAAEIGKRRWKFLVDIYGAEGAEVLRAFLTPARQGRGR